MSSRQVVAEGETFDTMWWKSWRPEFLKCYMVSCYKIKISQSKQKLNRYYDTFIGNVNEVPGLYLFKLSLDQPPYPRQSLGHTWLTVFCRVTLALP